MRQTSNSKVRSNTITKTLAALAAAICLAVSCDDETGSIGGKVMPSHDDMEVTQNIFSVMSRSVKVDSVLGTTSTGYLGKVSDPETDAITYCDFMAQFYPLENFSLPDVDSIVKDNGVIEADSVDISLFIDSYYGDSLNSMKLGVYELDTANTMRENTIYYSNIDPWQYVNQRPGAIRKEITFAVVDRALSDSLQNVYSSTNKRNILVRLPKEYGTFLMRKYYENPGNFTNAYNFTHNICAGFYYRLLSGNGTMLNITPIYLQIYFRSISNDSIYDSYQKITATEEVIQNTRIENKNLDRLLNEDRFTYLKTPAGIYTEVTLPIDSIYANGHDNDTLNSAKISFSRMNDDTLTEYNLPQPGSLLMLKVGDYRDFFENSKVADGATSYVTTFSSSDNAYTFSNIAALVSNMQATRKEGAGVRPTDSEQTIAAKYAAWEAANPNWNKVLLIPVTTSYSQQNNGYTTQQVLSRVRNDLSLTSTRLVGGNTGDIKISVIYSRFKQ